jgi:zinc protease
MAQMEQLTMQDLKNWLTPQLKDSFVEIAIVGDFKPEEAIAAVAKTFGALPKRQGRPSYDAERQVKQASAGEKLLPIKSSIEKALVAVHWPTQDRRVDIKTSRQLNLLASILEDRINNTVREELGQGYSPHVASKMSDTFTGDGNLIAFLMCKKENAGSLAKISDGIGAKLAAEGVTEDDVLRAKEPILKMLQEQQRKNEWWLTTVLAEAHSSPQRLDWPASMENDYNSTTKADLEALAKKYLPAGRAVTLRIEPK